MNKTQYLSRYKEGLAILLCLLYHCYSVVTLSAESKIEFKDAQLKKSIERALGISDPNRVEMLALEVLDVSYESIQFLDGLEYAANLRLLDISYNDIAHLEPLAGIKSLSELDISGLKAADLSSISSLSGLSRLWAGDNNLSDISFVSSLTNLFHLDLSQNEISDLKPLGPLYYSLSVLYLSNNHISDVLPLQKLLQLTELTLNGNTIENIDVLCNLSKLKYLVLSDNSIRNIGSLEYLPHLEMLSVNQNPLDDKSIKEILPNVWKSNEGGQDRITIYFDRSAFDPDIEFWDREFIISKEAKLSPNENYLLFAAGPKANTIPGLESGGRLLILSTGVQDSNTLIPVPVVKSDLMGGMLGSMGWRNEHDFHVLTDMCNGASPQLFLFSVMEQTGTLAVARKSAHSEFPFVSGLQWSPDGRFLSGNTFGMIKKKAILDYEHGVIRKYDMPYSSRYCWGGDKTLFVCFDNQIIRSTLQGIATTEQDVIHKGKQRACLGGVINDKPVYAVDNAVYWGQVHLYTAAENVSELFVGKTRVAFVCKNTIGVVDLKGREIFNKTTADNEHLLAFSETKGVLYLLTHDRTRIEACDFIQQGKMSPLCSIDEIKNVLSWEKTHLMAELGDLARR